MSRALDRIELGARIAKLVAETWGIWQDKRREAAEKERRLKELETEIATLKAAQAKVTP